MKTIFTKRILFGIGLSLIGAFASAQNGLENIIVEKYYISNADDAAASVGTLPIGSTTYRIFIDMKQGYKFQMAYGSATHNLSIKTTTSFFNNEDFGATNPNFAKTKVKNNTVMLDSWLSVGAACVGNFGIPKSEDNGVATVVNADGILKNNDNRAGIPLTTQDGMIAGTPGSFTTLGIDSAIAVFDATSQVGNSFVITSGAWACLSGAVGPDSTNKVLIAQITTDGDLTFELNIQIGTPSGGAEKYVAKNPLAGEILYDCLNYPNACFTTSVADPQTSLAKSTRTDISVFPNPMNEMFTLNISSLGDNSSNYYKVSNILGSVLINKKIEGSSSYTENVDVSSFAKGVYFVEVSANGLKKTIKLIKQ